MNPLAVTGFGVVGPLGLSADAWKEPSEHVFGAGPAEVLSTEKFPEACVASAKTYDEKALLGDKGLRNLDRLTKMMIVSAKLTLEHAGIKMNGAFITGVPDEVGICCSTAYGSLEAITEHKLIFENEDPRYINPSRFPNTVINASAGYVSIWEELRAPNVTVVDGNCGALDAILSASTHLDRHRAKRFLVGGAEVLSEALYLAFRMLGALADRSQIYRPGSLTSQGMRLGEGAAFCCVEPIGIAEQRHAKIQAVIKGYGTAFVPPRSEALLISVSPRAVKNAIEDAISDAQLTPQDIDAVCSAVCGLPLLDQPELEGIEAALGSHVPIFAPKTLHGETFGASGALGILDAWCLMQGVTHYPRISGPINDRSPECVLILTVGYYGNVSAVVLTRE